MIETSINDDKEAAHAAVLGLLGAAGFASVASTRLCDAMLPALAQDFATSTHEAASAISVYAVSYSVMQLLSGPLGDRFGKPRVIGLAAASCAVTTLCAALAPSMQALVLARAAMGAGTAAIVPLTVAWIGDTVALSQRQQTLARYSGFTVFGMVLGPLLGGFVTQALSWRAAFALLAPLFAWLAIVLLLRPSSIPAGADVRGQPAVPYVRQVAMLLQSRWTRIVLLGAFLETALGIATMAFVPTVLHERFALPPAYGGGVAALFGIGGFMFSRAAAPLLLRLRPATMPAIGGTALAFALCLLAAMPHWSWATIACPLAGFGFFALHNTLQVRATQLSTTATGVAVSMFTCCVFIGQSVGVAIGAYTFTRFAPGWSFAIAAAGLLVLGLGLRHAVSIQSAPATSLPASEG